MAEVTAQTLPPAQQAQAARDLRQDKRQAPAPQSRLEREKADLSKETGAEKSMRLTIEKREALKKKEMQQKAERAKEKAKSDKQTFGEMGKSLTAKALKFSWLNVIDTYGLTLLYIYFHFFGKYVVSSSYFVDFGEEWTYEVNKDSGIKTNATAAKYGEIILLILVTCLLILIIAMILVAILLPAVAVIAAVSWLKGIFGL